MFYISIYLFVVICQCKIMPISGEKYVTYDFDILNYDKNCSFVIKKNNISYTSILNISLYHYYSFPWCMFDTHNIYEYDIICNDNKINDITKFSINKIIIYNATEISNTYTIFVGNRYNKKYALISVWNSKYSFNTLCLYLTVKFQTSNNYGNVKIHNDNDICNYDSFSNSYYITDPVFEYYIESDKVYASNIVVGCKYLTGIGPFDIRSERKYIMEISGMNHNEITTDIIIASYIGSNIYITTTIVFGSMCAFLMLLGVIGCMIYTK